MKHAKIRPCDEWAEQLAAHHPNDLPAEVRAALNAHLQGCASCRAVYAGYQEVARLVKGLPDLQMRGGVPTKLLEEWEEDGLPVESDEAHEESRRELHGEPRLADRVKQKLGNYLITGFLGRGAFAEVYLGEHMHLGNKVAIKVPYADLASRDEIHKFRSEARVLVELVHPHIVRILDFGEEGGIPYLVMDFAPKGNLRQRHPKGSILSPLTVLPYIHQIAEGLSFAHAQRFIHRDIKPENLLLNRHDEVLVGDFGLALFVNMSYTRLENTLGTVPYMAPEQLQGKPQWASDQYALGVVVYEWLTGSPPFEGTWHEIASQHLLKPPRPLSALRAKNAEITPAIDEVVLRALAKDPTERFPGITAFAEAFEHACRSLSYGKSALPVDRTTSRRRRAARSAELPFVSRSSERSRLREEWLREGNARSRVGDYLEALEAYERVIELEPTDAQAYRRKGVALRELRRYEEALRAYTQAILYDPEDALAYYGKGLVLTELDRPDEALAAFEQTLQRDPAFTDASIKRGLVLLALKRPRESLLAFEHVLASENNDGYVWFCKGEALRALGRRAEADQAYQRARELGYGGQPGTVRGAT